MTEKHFESPRRLIRRAGKHIDEFESLQRAFIESLPYAETTQPDFQNKQFVYKMRVTEPLPEDLPALVNEATGNLRSALDQAVYASAVALGNANPEKTAFPIEGSLAAFEAQVAGKRFRDVPPEILALLAGFKPYPGGNDLLFDLNRIRNANMHRILVPLLNASMGTSTRISMSGNLSGSEIGLNRWDPLTNSVEFLRVGMNTKPNYEVNIAMEIVFGDVPPEAQRPVLPHLRAMHDVAGQAVELIAAETARLAATRI